MIAVEELERLGILKEKGFLTEEEYEYAKYKILHKDEEQISLTQNTPNDIPLIVQVNGKYCSAFITFILCLFGGCLGLHRFYTGYPFAGILYIMTGGFFFLGWFIDLLLIAFGGYRDSNGNPLI